MVRRAVGDEMMARVREARETENIGHNIQGAMVRGMKMRRAGKMGGKDKPQRENGMNQGSSQGHDLELPEKVGRATGSGREAEHAQTPWAIHQPLAW